MMRRFAPGPELSAGNPSLGIDGRKDSFGDIRESRGLLGSALKGRTIVYVVDDRDYRAESVVLKMGVFSGACASENSRVLKYSEFFGAKPFRADVLMLRSSRLFPYRITELELALRRFRAENPESAAILCVFDHCTNAQILRLAETGVVNIIDDNPPNDFELLRKAFAVLGALAPKQV